jgi:hypothetical protein
LAPWSLSVPPGRPAVRAPRLGGCSAARLSVLRGCPVVRLSVLAGHQAVGASRLAGRPDCPCFAAPRLSVLPGCPCLPAPRPDGGGLRLVPGFVEAVVPHDQLLDLRQLACVKCRRRFVE